MSERRLSRKAQRDMDERFALEREALDIFTLVVREWESDPTSVQCFDLRIVQRARAIRLRLKQLDPLADVKP